MADKTAIQWSDATWNPTTGCDRVSPGCARCYALTWADDGTPTWPLPLPNVWLGTSVENARWRTRIDELRQIPAAVRFLSCEPLLGPLVCVEHRTGAEGDGCIGPLDLSGIDWVIVGGESGRGARRMLLEWVHRIVQECREQGAAPFVKQLGEVWSHETLGRHGHAGDIERFPADLRIREFPAVRS